MSRVTHFEIQAADPNRAIRFYEASLGWEFHKWGDQEYWLITTGPKDQPGINGGLIRRRGELDGEAVIAYVCTIEVDAIDRIIAAVLENDGRVVVPKTHMAGVGELVYCKDTEGNIFGLMQPDPLEA